MQFINNRSTYVKLMRPNLSNIKDKLCSKFIENHLNRKLILR